MPFKLNLSSKALLILLVPLASQIVIFGVLAKLQGDSEKEVNAIGLPLEIIFDLATVYEDLLKAWSGADRYNVRYLTSPDFDETRRDAIEKMNRLAELLKNDPQEQQLIVKTRERTESVIQLMEENEDSLVTNIEEKKMKAKAALAPLAIKMTTVLYMAADVPQAIEKYTSMARATIDRWRLADNRYERVLVWGGLAEAVLLAAAALFWSRDIGSRIRTMKDNTYRIASQRPLNKRLKGSDELARLDAVMHKMSEAITEATRSEQVIAKNAKDVICSLDERLSFLEANQASAVVFGYHPPDLMRMKLATIMPPSEVQNALSYFARAKTRPEDSFELRLLRKDQNTIDTLWSVRWSIADGAFYCVVHDNTSRKQSERQRNELVQLISQDLKTPLSTLVDSLVSLESGRLGTLSERGQQLLTVARSATAQMLTLVNDLLDIENIEAGTLNINLSECALAPVFEQARLGVMGLSQKNQVNVVLQPNDVSLVADADRIAQILVNLMSNAIKFSPSGATVLVRARNNLDTVEVQVVDQGRGIPADKISSIFDRFKQVTASDATVKGGSGLGLAICKALVQMHGGEIKVESKEGAGSVFSFWLPRRPQKNQVSERGRIAT
ncbi:MAG TPA: ATP-binding protein [Chroococcales cyanobacterium]